MKTFRRQTLLAVGLLISSFTAVQATPIGTVGFGGEVEVTLTTLDFTPFVAGPALNGTGRVAVLGNGTGVLSALSQFNAQNDGTIVDRSVTAGVVPAQPAGAPISVPSWLVFDDPAFNYTFDLLYITPGLFSAAECGAAPASGQNCTPAAPAPFTSPYNLTNFIDSQGRLSSTAAFTFSGVMRNKDTGVAEYNFNGVIGTEFLGIPYQEVLNELFNGSGSVVTRYSGTIEVTQIPEPSTVGLMVSALVGIAGLRIRRRARS